MISSNPIASLIWHDTLIEMGIPFEDVQALNLGGSLVVYFTTSNLCSKDFIENLARSKGFPPLLLATDSTHHIWSFKVQ